MMDRQATQSYKFVGAPRSDQAAVWGEVSRKLNAMGSRSPSSELQAVYRDYERKLAEAMEHLPAPEGFHGAVFTIAGRISGAGLFDKTETLRKLWPKLVRSCASDAFEASKENYKSATAPEIASWIGRGACATPTVFPSPGIGQDIRIEGQDIFGAGLLVEDQPVHVELFGFVRGAQFRPPSRPVREPDRGQRAKSADDPVAGKVVWGAKWLNRIFRGKPTA